ncbi:hypothetical protein G9A89_012958 [Geosiphon pyriformis]|nr:hypothetical protein G9A89_012958 [Geosiphon pyriformis]
MAKKNIKVRTIRRPTTRSYAKQLLQENHMAEQVFKELKTKKRRQKKNFKKVEHADPKFAFKVGQHVLWQYEEVWYEVKILEGRNIKFGDEEDPNIVGVHYMVQLVGWESAEGHTWIVWVAEKNLSLPQIDEPQENKISPPCSPIAAISPAPLNEIECPVMTAFESPPISISIDQDETSSLNDEHELIGEDNITWKNEETFKKQDESPFPNFHDQNNLLTKDSYSNPKICNSKSNDSNVTTSYLSMTENYYLTESSVSRENSFKRYDLQVFNSKIQESIPATFTKYKITPIIGGGGNSRSSREMDNTRASIDLYRNSPNFNTVTRSCSPPPPETINKSSGIRDLNERKSSENMTRRLTEEEEIIIGALYTAQAHHLRTRNRFLTMELNKNAPDMPSALKEKIVFDWEWVSMNCNKIALPSAYPINNILRDYITSRPKLKHYVTLAKTIGTYFNNYLASHILYPSEVDQYWRVKSNYHFPQVSQLYGAEHLLRMFVKLPKILEREDGTASEAQSLCLPATRLDVSNVGASSNGKNILTEANCADFLMFLNERGNKYFIPEYRDPVLLDINGY